MFIRKKSSNFFHLGSPSIRLLQFGVITIALWPIPSCIQWNKSFLLLREIEISKSHHVYSYVFWVTWPSGSSLLNTFQIAPILFNVYAKRSFNLQAIILEEGIKSPWISSFIRFTVCIAKSLQICFLSIHFLVFCSLMLLEAVSKNCCTCHS